MKQKHTCPNCGAELSINFFLTLARGQKTTHNTPGLFQSTAPTGYFSSLWHRVIRNRPLPTAAPPKPDIIVRSERRVSSKELLINELRVPATQNQLYMLAVIYIDQKVPWSREATVSRTNISQTKHNRIAAAFQALGFLKKVTKTKYELTEDGRIFLSHFLSDTPLHRRAWG